MKRVLVGVVVVASLLAMPAAGAAPVDEPSRTVPAGAPGLWDRNGDGVSDDLAAELAGLAPNERIDVVVTWEGLPDVALAHRRAGAFAINRHFTIIDGFAASMTAAQVRALSRTPGVFRVERDFEVSLTMNEATADYGIDAARADFGMSGAGISFCVLDTGIDVGHEQLDSQLVGRDPGVDYWQDFINGQPYEYDDHGHGTHVSSILAGDGVGTSGNAAAYRGVAPDTKILTAKVLSGQGSGSESGIIAGIEWCVQNGADGISMSLGTQTGSDGLDALSQAVNSAVAQGVVALVAAGNAGDGPESVGSPGAASGAITIGAASKISDGPYLAPFSSRGPTLSGLTKPDLAAPGVAIGAADANTGAGYVAYSGTSMATPFTAGTAALMLQCNGSLSPGQMRSLLTSTAFDMGLSGTDDNWGAGLLDGYGAVAAACGGSGGMSLRTHENLTARVPNNGTWSHTFTVDASGVGEPIAATLLIDGEVVCVYYCFFLEWSPDLDARLIDPTGAVIAATECPAYGDCGTMGQQETIHVTANRAGDYTLEVYPWSGTGGDIVVDLFYGPVDATPPAPNIPPTADAGPDQTVVDSDGDGWHLVTLDGTGSSDPDGTVVSWEWSTNHSGPTHEVNFAVGEHAITLTVTDEDGATATDTVVITVEPAPNVAPTADAGPDQIVEDTDGNGQESVTLNGSGSTDDTGIVSYEWSKGLSTIATGATPTVTLDVGVHTVTLTVTDDDGATDTDTVTISVTDVAPPPPPPPPTLKMHVGDLDASTEINRQGRWRANVTVAVHDGSESAVSGATVSFGTSDGRKGSCTTDASGTCTVTSRWQRSNMNSLTVTVTSVDHATLPYDSAGNHDETDADDSNGTAITIDAP